MNMTESYSMKTDEPEFIYYVYALTVEGNNVQYPEIGIDGEHVLESIQFRNIQALVSRVPYGIYNRDSLLQKTTDPIWLEIAVRNHTAIVNAIHSDHGIIPMRFLTLCKSNDEIESFLSKYIDSIDAVLKSVRGSSEWGVKVFCDSDKLQQVILERDEQIKKLNRRIVEFKEGTSFLLQKKKTRLVKESLARICAQRTEECHSHLATLAHDMEQVALQREGLSDRAGSMIFNSAYLVDNDRVDDFEDMITWLNEQYSDQGFEFSHSGPWPPYHFVNRVS